MKAILVAGLAFGDEGKGACVDALTRHLPIDLIVRYNGGCQAAHHVVLPDARYHCFSQFGAGMLANDHVETYLSRFMLVEPFAMMNEARALEKLTPNVWERTTVDKNAVVITHFHKELNRLREQARGANAHGSCGRGIGVARELELRYPDQILRAGHLQNLDETAMRLIFMYSILAPEINKLDSRCGHAISSDMAIEIAMRFQEWPARIVDGFEPEINMVFEGAQGVMLDEKHGTAPHNTWTNTTFENADMLLDEAGVSMFDRVRIGCLRSYYTRHGAGPFPTENGNLKLPEPHNSNIGFQGMFRVGTFDFGMARKAIEIVHGVDCLAISHLDYLPRMGIKEWEFKDAVSDLATIGIFAHGPSHLERMINLEVMA